MARTNAKKRSIPVIGRILLVRGMSEIVLWSETRQFINLYDLKFMHKNYLLAELPIIWMVRISTNQSKYPDWPAIFKRPAPNLKKK